MMIQIVEDIFSSDQLEIINKAIEGVSIPTTDEEQYITSAENNGTGLAEELGRIQIGNISDLLPQKIIDTLDSIGKSAVEYPVQMDHILYTEYNKKYGKPNLPPHFDGDTNDFIINMQLSSNTSWDLGLNFNTYTLKDNSALIFNGNTEIHWRKHKEFQDGEYVKMLFIRFYNLEKRSDYSHVPMNQAHDIFKDVRLFRDNLQ